MDDRAVVERQLGRTPRAFLRVAYRCPFGAPAVTIQAPYDSSGEPFPTTFYLTCRHLVAAVSRLEAAGGIERWTTAVASDDTLAASLRDATEEQRAGMGTTVTAAYVAGPSEIAYYAQLLPVYERFGMQMPLIHPRKSVTLLDGAPDGLGVADVFRDVTALGPVSGSPHAELAPGGEPQERVLEVPYAENFVDELLDRLDLDDFDHQLIARG